MSLDLEPMRDALVSHAMACGHFETVNKHESVNAVGAGLHADLWGQHIQPVQAMSGLSSTSVRILFFLRIKTSADAEPRDDIDLLLMNALTHLMGLYTADFELGGAVSYIDLMGEHGIGLAADLNYFEQDERLYRVGDMVIPLICTDVWEQGG
ncbi:hypothetical protein Aph01nite_13140 [Acrocarpospora phusangensis]|uniref:Uncharacterized protein n=1 Tax=Acrocarpospora phusangensis TaxID=1070424 RepID=A0A919Q876_9ACTN|nr:hypothetical protein [Acrocarpospora phusangensis]GIH23004.1 hypothetical protein Aph01nite_13140 [Acrocarpospora phusangensis]